MAKAVGNIRSLHWQPALGRDGEVVEGVADVDQAIRIIVTTRKGQVPHRPEFGCDCMELVDRPVNEVRPRLVRDVRDAIERWERRAKVERVAVTPFNAGVEVSIHWRLAEGIGELQTTRIQLPSRGPDAIEVAA